MTFAKRNPLAGRLAVEDDERHSARIDDFIGRNREALNEALRDARGQGVSRMSVADVIAARRCG